MHLDIIEVRPRFRKIVPHSINEVTEIVKDGLQKSKDSVVGSISYNFITLKVPLEERRFWTPQLSISLEEEEDGTILNGLYGPRPDIWMLYMFLYFISGLLTLVVSIIGMSRYNLGLSAYILWLIPFTLGGGFVLWFTSKTGQNLAKDQTHQIHQFMEEHLLRLAKDKPYEH